ncbi:MAG: radical SAM protein [Clostridia bacterium]|nr:radical SAM protein [Clostridia bacterium]
MDICTLCPNECGVDRDERVGRCLVKSAVRIAKYYLHPFEEPIISGKNGSGTVFFCGCSLKCVFCQNYEVSRNLRGKEVTTNELADVFKRLEDAGADNINLVSPTQYADKIVKALNACKPSIPVCYNTHGYEKPSTVEMLNDCVDIYLPDLKYATSARSLRYSGIADYFETAYAAIKLMIKS